MILDGCSGAGGWAEGLVALGRDSLGVELDPDAVATSRAAGHRVAQADVTAIDPRELLDGEDCEGLIFGPPCPSFSAGGKRLQTRQRAVLLAHKHRPVGEPRANAPTLVPRPPPLRLRPAGCPPSALDLDGRGTWHIGR